MIGAQDVFRRAILTPLSGAGVSPKQTDAGKIGYQTWTTDSLDIVGAGATADSRKIKFWGEGGATFTGSLTVTGNATAQGLTVTKNTATGSLTVSGNAGIGTGTEVPKAKLQVSGAGGTNVDLIVNGRMRSDNNDGGLWVASDRLLAATRLTGLDCGTMGGGSAFAATARSRCLEIFS